MPANNAGAKPAAGPLMVTYAPPSNGKIKPAMIAEISPATGGAPDAIAMAKEVYGVTATSPIETEIAQMKKGRILTNADIRSVLVKRYGQEAVNNSSVGSVIDQIGSFLFGK